MLNGNSGMTSREIKIKRADNLIKKMAENGMITDSQINNLRRGFLLFDAYADKPFETLMPDEQETLSKIISLANLTAVDLYKKKIITAGQKRIITNVLAIKKTEDKK